MLARVTFSRDRTAERLGHTPSSEAVSLVSSILDRPDSELDYVEAKLAFDRFVDPSVDADPVHAELGRLTDAAWRLAGRDANPDARLMALRRMIYESGPWNGKRPFSYDQSDPIGQRLENKLLHNYVKNRLGQCVSMPILFLILGERLGLDVALAHAPSHLLVRYTGPTGRSINLETTSGAHPARLEWYRQGFPISDRALETGIYMRSLTKREAIAGTALTIVEHLNAKKRFEDIFVVGTTILDHDQLNVAAMLSIGSVCGKLLDQFRGDYPQFWKWTSGQKGRAESYVKGNMNWFALAEHLGWLPFEEDESDGISLAQSDKGRL